jgi:hypothetical protein
MCPVINDFRHGQGCRRAILRPLTAPTHSLCLKHTETVAMQRAVQIPPGIRSGSLRGLPVVANKLGSGGCGGRSVLLPGYGIGLRTFLAGDDVELNLIAFLQRLVSIHLNGRVMYENVRPVFPANKAKTFGVVEPLDCAFVLSHRISPFLFHQRWRHLGSR